MAYADYTFYKNEYFGQTIEEAEFMGFSTRASLFLDYYTQGRASEFPGLSALKMACCAIAEQYKALDMAQKAQITGLSGGTEVQSQTVGDWTRTYRNPADAAAGIIDTAQSELSKIAQMYLAHTGLLYRGGWRCCH